MFDRQPSVTFVTLSLSPSSLVQRPQCGDPCLPVAWIVGPVCLCSFKNPLGPQWLADLSPLASTLFGFDFFHLS